MMTVKQVMTRQVACCGPEDTLHQAAHLMWEHDCGVIPVLDSSSRVIGMITDRDVCMAAYTQGLPLEAMRVRPVMSTDVVCCHPDDALRGVEERMRARQVRRVPVVDDAGTIVGIVSMNDLVLTADRRRERQGIVDTLAAISRHRGQDLAAE